MAQDDVAQGDGGAEGLRALMQCLAVVAGADKRLTLSEIEVVAALYAEESGRQVDPDVIGEVFAQLRDCEPSAALAELRAGGRRLGPETRERIVKACYRVMVADRSVDARERERLSEIAAALEIGEKRVERLIRETRG